MKTAIIIGIASFIIISSCRNSGLRENTTQEQPAALAEGNNKSSGSYSIKRGDGNILENLYNELATKDQTLITLEKKLTQLSDSKNDSTESYLNFHQKNNSYYTTANAYVKNISDSLLREELQKTLTASLNKYDYSIKGHEALIELLNNNNIKLQDLHQAVKIIKTLPLIENFQKNELPDTSSKKGYINQQVEVMQLEKKIISKP